MKNRNAAVIRSAIAGVLGLGLAAAAGQAMAAEEAIEKCAGIVKAGMNDCGTSTTHCQGSIKVDGHKEAWIKVPKGTCAKILGGYVTTSPYAKPGGKGKG